MSVVKSFIAILLFPPVLALNARGALADDTEFFEKKIRPLLAENCYQCHSRDSEKLKAGLLLDSRDGVLKGLNLEATAELARAVTIPVIASGGLAGIEDVKRLLDPRYTMLEGAIAGRALYDGRLDPREALALLKERREAQKAKG